MKRIAPFTLSFVLVLLLGFIAEMMAQELFYQAESILGSKPFPPTTEWIFDTFAVWGNGSILCLFLIPWALLLFYALVGPCERGPVERDIRLLYGFVAFAIGEAILFVFFTTSSLLPFLEIWKGFSPKPPASAYVPHILLCAVFFGVIIAAIRRSVRRRARGGDVVSASWSSSN